MNEDKKKMSFLQRWGVVVASSLFVFVFVMMAGSVLAGTEIFDWDVQTWIPPGSAGPYEYPAVTPIQAIPMTVTIGFGLQNGAAFAAATPLVQTTTDQTFDCGKTAPAEQNMKFTINATTNDGSSAGLMTITFTERIMTFTMTICDVDYANGTPPLQFQDVISVEASLAGSPTTAVLSAESGSPTFSIVNGRAPSAPSVATATGNAPNKNNVNSVNGNVLVTVAGPMDRIDIRYTSGPLAVANPNDQGIAIGDFTYTPVNATAVTLDTADVQPSTNVMAWGAALVALLALAAVTVLAWHSRRQHAL
jgi:hypothetical protein